MTTLNLNKLFLLTLSLVLYYSAFSQRATRHFIDSILLKRDTEFKSTQGIVYVVNGVPFDTLSLDNVLGDFETKHLLDAFYWNGRKHGHYPFYGDAAIIVFAHHQKSKSKHKVWKSAKNLFNDISNPPVLLIDNSIIDPTISKATFQKIRLKDIMYIDRIQFGDENRIRIWKTQ